MKPKLLTAKDVAAILDCDPATVRRWSRERKIGQPVGPAKAYTLEDVERLRKLVRGVPGNPKFKAGNKLWRKRKSHGRKPNNLLPTDE